jgi:hypothetical protein
MQNKVALYEKDMAGKASGTPSQVAGGSVYRDAGQAELGNILRSQIHLLAPLIQRVRVLAKA